MALVKAISLVFLVKLDKEIPIKKTPFVCVVLLVWSTVVLSFEYIVSIYHGINLHLHFFVALLLYLVNSLKVTKKMYDFSFCFYGSLQLFTTPFLTTISLISCCIFTLVVKVIDLERWHNRKKEKSNIEKSLEKKKTNTLR